MTDKLNFSTIKGYLEHAVETTNKGVGTAIVEALNNANTLGFKSAIDFQQAQFNTSMAMGQSKAYTDTINKQIAHEVRQLRLAQDYNFGIKEAAESRAGIQARAGRRFEMGEGDMTAYAASSVLIQDKEALQAIAAEYALLGKSMRDVGSAAAKMFTEAQKNGLSLKNISETVKNNISKVNQYGFKNGVDGLREMAAYSEKIGLKFEQALAAAQKMQSIEGSIQATARLSTLGGNFAALANPLEMMSESLTNVEGLQERIGKMFSGMAKWNSAKGGLDISAFDRLRIQSAAEALGMSKEEAIKSVEVQGRRELIEKQAGGLNLDENIKSLIANSGTFNEAGQAGYVIDGQFKSLDEIAGNASLQEDIKKLNQDEGKDVKDIARDVRTMEMLMTGQVKGEEAKAVETQYEYLTGTEHGESIEDYYKSLFTENGIITKIIGGADDLNKAFDTAKSSVTKFAEQLNKELSGENIKGVVDKFIRNFSISNILNFTPAEAKQQGGPIGGLPHTQGGTLIEAELGEYVVNRNAASQFRGLLDEINSYRNPGPISVQPEAPTFQQGGEIIVPRYAAGGSIYNASPTINYSSAVSYDTPSELSDGIKTAITRAIQEYDASKKQAEILSSGRREY